MIERQFIASTIVQVLRDLEEAFRRLHPLAIPQLREKLLVHLKPLMTAHESLIGRGRDVPEELGEDRLSRVCEIVLDATRTFGVGEGVEEEFVAAQRAGRKSCQAQEALFPLRKNFPVVNGYFLEAGANPSAIGQDVEKEDERGLSHSGYEQERYARAGYSLYIPEHYTSERRWPLVVALHGGHGHGRDFIWSWLREARTRGFILLAPTSQGQTWSLLDMEVDAHPLTRRLNELCSSLAIDRGRVLITGMSDGGTYALGAAMSKSSPYTAVAPFSSALLPLNMDDAVGKRIFWVHGAQDWMFPVNWAVQACQVLARAGAEVKIKVVPDLAHAYPREENDTVLNWFDPQLAKPSCTS